MSTETVIDPSNYSAIIGIRLEPGNGEPDLFTMLVVNFDGPDYPVTIKSRCIFFTDLGSARSICQTSDNAEVLLSTPDEVALVINPTEAVEILQTQDIDPNSIVINFLNVCFDLLKGTPHAMPEEYNDFLYKLADHLTFTNQVHSYFSENQIERRDTVDACLWLIGAIASSATIINRPLL